MTCKQCNGLGYREYEAGLIRLRCRACNGSGQTSKVLLPSKSGRPKKNIPLDRIRELSQKGMGVKAIAKQLQREGSDISDMTVVQALRRGETRQ
jgi:hypothetical protein